MTSRCPASKCFEEKQKKIEKSCCEHRKKSSCDSIKSCEHRKTPCELRSHHSGKKSDMADQLKKQRIVFVIGGPGSGKGTQCDEIIKKYGFTHLSTGDLLREEVSAKSSLGQKAKSIMDKGELVPLELVLQMLKDAMIKKAASSKGFLIDGYPRELEQGIRFEKEVAQVECAIYFKVADETMKKRLLKRAETSGRSDDNEKTIVTRIQTFHSTSQPVIDYYTKQNRICVIEAEGTVQEIFAKVTACLDKKK